MAITFDVSPVEPATTPLPTDPFTLGLERALGLGVEACGGAADALVRGVRGHPFLGAVHLAFDQHRPLALRPDDVWLLIAQGLAQHVKQDAEALRGRFVDSAGQQTIAVRRDDFQPGQANPWRELLDELTDGVGRVIGRKRDLVVADFSTTGPAERAASQVALLDAMKPYVRYELLTLCGIPRITLLGTPADWRSVATRARYLGELGLEAWSSALAPVLERFVEASLGRPDPAFWRSFYKLESASGGPQVTGWVNVFFPFLQDAEGRVTANRHALKWSEKRGPSTGDFPRGMSRAPFTWRYLTEELRMELLGGFVGASQDPATSAVRPEIAWAVRRETSPTPEPTVEPDGRRVHHVFFVGPRSRALDEAFDAARASVEEPGDAFELPLTADETLRVSKAVKPGIVPSAVVLVVAGPDEDWAGVTPTLAALERELLRAGRLAWIPTIALWDCQPREASLRLPDAVKPFLQNVRVYLRHHDGARCLAEVQRVLAR